MQSFGLFILICCQIALRAYIGSLMWGWFIVPTFHLPYLDTLHVYGISLLLTLYRHRDIDDEKDPKPTTWKVVVLSISIDLMGLGCAAICHALTKARWA